MVSKMEEQENPQQKPQRNIRLKPTLLVLKSYDGAFKPSISPTPPLVSFSYNQGLPQKALGITVFVDNQCDPSLGASLTLLLVPQWGTTEKPL